MESESIDLTFWIMCGLAVLVALDKVFRFYKEHIREDPRPAQTYATKVEHDKLVGIVGERFLRQDDRFEALDTKLEKMIRDSDRTRSANIGALHEKIEDLGKEIRKEMKMDNGGLHTRITELLDRFSELKGKVEAQMKP